jgi:nicotinamide-nucleotide amidase
MVIMLPGPPRECRAMLEYRVRPLLASRAEGVIVSHNIKFWGIGESEMEYKLRDYMNELENPTLAPYAKEGECLARVTAKAATVEEAERMMAPVIGKLYAEWLTGGPRHEIFDRCRLERFTGGGTEKEDFIIG